jgi:hypothetical protein
MGVSAEALRGRRGWGAYVDAHAKRHLELGGAKRRRELILHDLNPRLVAHDLLAFLDLKTRGQGNEDRRRQEKGDSSSPQPKPCRTWPVRRISMRTDE